MSGDGIGFMVVVCAVCGGDRRLCQHVADEWYDALLGETRRHLAASMEGYARLLAWHHQNSRNRGEMKRRIKELEAREAKLLTRLRDLTG